MCEKYYTLSNDSSELHSLVLVLTPEAIFVYIESLAFGDSLYILYGFIFHLFEVNTDIHNKENRVFI